MLYVQNAYSDAHTHNNDYVLPSTGNHLVVNINVLDASDRFKLRSNRNLDNFTKTMILEKVNLLVSVSEP
jgi:hypothetical protein